MLTVNLEKELIRQNKKILLPEELLSIKEYDRLGDSICNDEVLGRVGLNSVAIKGKRNKEYINRINSNLKKYDSDKIFHISQIESLCKKYHLRFLPSFYFMGSIDKELSNKISTFEVANITKMNANDCFIAAPSSSFKLEKKPKDPLFFYKLDDGFYYLIHKWGNDLSLIRRCYAILSNAWVTYLSIAIPLLYTFILANHRIYKTGQFEVEWYGVVSIIAFLLYTAASVIIYIEGGEIRFIKENNWNSYFL